MSACTAIAESQEATADAILAVTKHGEPWGQGAYLVMRAAALQHNDIKGGLATAEKLRALADELEGGA